MRLLFGSRPSVQKGDSSRLTVWRITMNWLIAILQTTLFVVWHLIGGLAQVVQMPFTKPLKAPSLLQPYRDLIKLTHNNRCPLAEQASVG